MDAFKILELWISVRISQYKRNESSWWNLTVAQTVPTFSNFGLSIIAAVCDSFSKLIDCRVGSNPFISERLFKRNRIGGGTNRLSSKSAFHRCSLKVSFLDSIRLFEFERNDETSWRIWRRHCYLNLARSSNPTIESAINFKQLKPIDWNNSTEWIMRWKFVIRNLW